MECEREKVGKGKGEASLRPFNVEVEQGYRSSSSEERGLLKTKKKENEKEAQERRTDFKHAPSFLINQPRNPLDSTSSSKSSNSGFSDSPSLSAT
jgi:hypothetical protein